MMKNEKHKRVEGSSAETSCRSSRLFNEHDIYILYLAPNCAEVTSVEKLGTKIGDERPFFAEKVGLVP